MSEIVELKQQVASLEAALAETRAIALVGIRLQIETLGFISHGRLPGSVQIDNLISSSADEIGKDNPELRAIAAAIASSLKARFVRPGEN